MKQVLILLLIVCVPFLSFGQRDTIDFKIVIRDGPSYAAYPTLILKIDTINIKLDSISAKMINPKWIKRVEVIKDEKHKHLYGNGVGVIFIYPKKRKRNRLIELFGSHVNYKAYCARLEKKWIWYILTCNV